MEYIDLFSPSCSVLSLDNNYLNSTSLGVLVPENVLQRRSSVSGSERMTKVLGPWVVGISA